MRKLLIAILVSLLLAIAIAWGLKHYPGYVMIALGNTTIEMTLWVAVILQILAIAGLFVALWLLTRSIKVPMVTLRWLGSFGGRNTPQIFNRGLIAFAEGHWDRSRRSLERAAKNDDNILIHMLVCARASHRLGDEEAVEKYLTRALQTVPDAHAAINITQAELQLESGHYEKALATILRLRKDLGKKHPYLLEMLVKTCLGLKDYRLIEKLLPEIKNSSAYDAQRYSDLLVETYRHRLIATKGAEDAVKALTERWAKIPKKWRRNNSLMLCYVDLLAASGGEKTAVDVIQRHFRKYWDDKILAVYGRIAGSDLKKQLLLAESWLKERNNNPELLLALARISRRLELWGKAKEYYQRSLDFGGHVDAYVELAELCQGLGEVDKSREYFQRSLNTRPTALSLPLPAKPLR